MSYQQNACFIFFRIIDKKHTKVDIEESPYDIANVTIKIIVKDGFWAENDTKFEYTEGAGIEVLEANKGYFKLHMSGADTAALDNHHHLFYLIFTFDSTGLSRTVIKDFIEILK